MQKKNKHTVATPENSKAAFINTQSTYLVKANNHDNWQEILKNNFVLFFPEKFIAGFG